MRSRSRTYSRSPSPRYHRRFTPSSRVFRGAPKHRYDDGRDKPEPCPCLGVFGMSLHTNERDLKKIFRQFGEVDSVQIVYDRFSGRSRGFGFVYFLSTKDATRAKEGLKDALIDGMKVRVDYSVTKGGGPHRHVRSRSPTRSRSRSHSRSRSRRRSPVRSSRHRSTKRKSPSRTPTPSPTKELSRSRTPSE